MSIRRALASTQTVVLGQDLFRTVRDRIDPEWVAEALEAGDVDVRRRKMPAEFVVWLVVGACLFAHMSFVDVVRQFGLTARTRRGGVQTPPSAGAVAEARGRVGGEAMGRLLRICATKWLEESDHERFHGLRVLAADGVTFPLTDTRSNDETYGRPAGGQGVPAAYPQARAVCLVDVFTHLVVDAAIGPYRRVEIPLFDEIVPRIPNRTVTILDRGFRSLATAHTIQTHGVERHWVVRAWSSLKYDLVRSLGPGDDLIIVRPGYDARKRNPLLPRELTVRLITFQVRRTTFRVLTSLVDSRKYPASEVAGLYALRWEAEMVFDDIKTEQRGARQTLRSKTPDGVLQEIYAILLGHNVVRIELARAAELARLPPVRLSFHRGLQQIQHFMAFAGGTSAPSKTPDREMELRAMLGYLTLPERRSTRWYPRVLKSTIPKYPRKKPVPASEMP